MDSPAASQESMDSESLGGVVGGRCFPSDELVNFHQQLTFLRNSNYSPMPLVACLETACHIMKLPDRRQTDVDSVRRFLRDDLSPGIDSVLDCRIGRCVDTCFESLVLLAQLAVAVLEYRREQSPAVLSELDADVTSLLLTLMHAFGKAKHLYAHFGALDAPEAVLEKHGILPPEIQWVHPQLDTEQQDEDMQEVVQETLWSCPINIFGSHHGFDLLTEILMSPSAVNFTMLNGTLAVIAQVADGATDEAKAAFVKVVDPIAGHVADLMASNPDRLADHGNDRSFHSFHCLAHVNLQRTIDFCCSPEESILRTQQLQELRCAFVSKMLDSSSFNKLLSAAKHCNKLVDSTLGRRRKPHGQQLLQDLWSWMCSDEIVRRLLRTGLHHKQYMTEVQGVMTQLTEHSQLTAEHLDLMWAITEKEDAYDAVKTHMFDLLAAVASKCQPSQLDMLFAKLEGRQARSVQDTERLLLLLTSLAESDTQLKMLDKIVGLVWDTTMPADAPPQLLDLRAMDNVMRAYRDCMEPAAWADYVYQLTCKCLSTLKDGKGGQVPLLRTMCHLLALLPIDPKYKTPWTIEGACDDLVQKQHATDYLVETVCTKVVDVQQQVLAAKAAAGQSSAGEAALSSVQSTAMADCSVGAWSYIDVISEHLTVLRYLATRCTHYFDAKLASKLWDTLLLTAVCGEGQLQAAKAFFMYGFKEKPSSSPYFEPATQLLLLEHLAKLDVEGMVLSTAELIWDLFYTVNTESKAIATLKNRRPAAIALDRVKGLELMWRIYLRSSDETVADLLRASLLGLYTTKPLLDTSPTPLQALVEELVLHLQDVTDKLSGTDSSGRLAVRTTSRCLAFATAAINAGQVPTMPSVPAHNRAWRGAPLLLEIQRDNSVKFRLATHENEYIGLLRERLARNMGCSAKFVRMFTMGHELTMDSDTVGSFGLRNRSVINVMESPEPNPVFKSPSEYRRKYERSSFSWMLSQADGLYPLLLRLIDMPCATQDLAGMARELLGLLPTYPALLDCLAAALDGTDKQEQLAGILDANRSSMLVDAQEKQQQEQPCAPYQVLYALQALCVLLFPTFDEALSSADREAAAEGSACQSPAATAPGVSPTQAPNSGPAPDAPAETPAAAAASAARHHQHREVQQQEFLHSRGLEVVLAAARKAAASSSQDLQLQRQLSELLVMLLHNLMDASQSWQPAPCAAAAPGTSNGPSAMSGAESGAGQHGAGAVHATPASSLVGAGAAAATAAVESVSMPLADAVQLAEPAGSTGAAANSKAAATTSETACHHPPSPAMEVSSPLPGRQQQQQQQQTQPTKQRQRGGDLPPLPPQAHQQQQQQQQPSVGPSAAFGVQGAPLSTLFSHDTLKLMADTLLSVAVDTSQLWGCSVPMAVLLNDDSSKDVPIAREALQLLLRLLEQQHALIQPLLLEVEQPPLVCIVLLSPYYSALRRQASELLEKLVSNDSLKQRLLPWLLLRLAAARPLANERPASCAEFYQLLSCMLMKLSHNWGVLPEQLYAVTSSMLDEEVAALQATAAGPAVGLPSPCSKPQRRRRRRHQALSIDGCASDTEDSQDPPACALLQGRLQLVLALVRVLDRRGVGVDGQGALMRLLLQDFLFPEAVQKLAAAAGQLDLQQCAAGFDAHCATPSCRKAALDLLAELMGDTPASLEEGITMLLNLHYQHEVLNIFGTHPRALRGLGQYAGLRNGGATCYMNAVFQQLYMQPGIRAGILGSQEVPKEELEGSVFAQLQAMFAQLALTKAVFVNPSNFWKAFKDYDGSPIDVREHQDAYEFFTRLQDFVDQHLISSGQQPAIKPIMGGTFVQQIICRDHDFVSERTEEFYQISVEVKGMGTLQKSLDDYVKGELMEGDNAYLCEELGKRVAAVKRTAIKALPQLLCVHLKRFEFDYHSQTRHKVRDRFEFPLELDMFPYTAEGLAAADQQQQDEQAHQQPTGSSQGQPLQLPAPGSAGAAAAGPGQCAAGSPTAVLYDLHGVVVHSGSAFTGHYYSFIKERAHTSSSGSSSSKGSQQPPRWYLFDDKDVSTWDVASLEYECFGGKPSQDSDARGTRPQRNECERAHSAYMLFYERRADAPDAPATPTGGTTQQQQQQQAACVGADVDMSAADVSQPSPAAAAFGGALQQQPGFTTPYGMPEALYRDIMDKNLTLVWHVHVLDTDYFRFVQQLVDSRGDLSQLTTRKSRRRDGVAAANAATAVAGATPGAGPGPATAFASGSSMACDTPVRPQQQQQPCLSAGSGALPMAVSPTPTPAASVGRQDGTAAAAAAAGSANPSTPPPLDMPSSGTHTAAADSQQSPGPSGRRGEEADAVAQALMRLGVLFQFEVYCRAHDSLRTETEQWTEALRSLMGTGNSSSACMLVFLELVQAHPQWLRIYLMEPGGFSPTSPRRWASDMLSWTLQAASKRCAQQLQQYVLACLAEGIYTCENNMPGSPAHQALQQHELTMRVQFLPPLGQALVGVVQQLCWLVHDSLPRMQHGQIDPECEVPCEPVRALLVYAETSPWAAAHLMQIMAIAPDLILHAHQAMAGMTEDDAAYEELVPVYDLLDELLSYASNLPQLAAEYNPDHPCSRHNPHLRQLPGCSSPSSSGSGTNGAAAAGGAAPPANIACTLHCAAYKRIVTEVFLRGLVEEQGLQRPRITHLLSLLSHNNEVIARWVGQQLGRVLHEHLTLSRRIGDDPVWEQQALNYSLQMLQLDDLLDLRVVQWALGNWTQLRAGMPEMHNRQAFKFGVLQYSQAPLSLLQALSAVHAVIQHFRGQAQHAHQRLQAQRVLIKLGMVILLHQRLSIDVQNILQQLATDAPMYPALQQLHDSVQFVVNLCCTHHQQQQQQLVPLQQQAQVEEEGEGEEEEEGAGDDGGIAEDIDVDDAPV